MSDTMKFCKDCKFHQEVWPGEPQTSRCFSPKRIIGINPVDGSEKASVTMCEVARSFEQHCGASAKWFEPREQTQEAAE